MKNLILIISIIGLGSIVSCNNDDCAGGSNSSSPPTYLFDVYFVDKFTGENLLGMDEQIVADSAIQISVLDNGVKHFISGYYSLLNDVEAGYL